MTKLKKVSGKKIGFYQIQKISKIVNGRNESMDGLPADISRSSDLPFFNFATKDS
jgi:hypothetical protein